VLFIDGCRRFLASWTKFCPGSGGFSNDSCDVNDDPESDPVSESYSESDLYGL
jgi:hypothetical protein